MTETVQVVEGTSWGSDAVGIFYSPCQLDAFGGVMVSKRD